MTTLNDTEQFEEFPCRANILASVGFVLGKCIDKLNQNLEVKDATMTIPIK
jgi:hypothetical protein